MKDLIAALAVLADPNASPDDKAAALDKLSAYFNAQLDAEEAKTKTEAEAAAEAAAEGDKAEKASGTDEDEGEKPSKQMASALATIEALGERLAKIEKASAVGSAHRAQTRTVLPRVEPKPTMSAQETVTIDMIGRAAQNTIRMNGKK